MGCPPAQLTGFPSKRETSCERSQPVEPLHAPRRYRSPDLWSARKSHRRLRLDALRVSQRSIRSSECAAAASGRKGQRAIRRSAPFVATLGPASTPRADYCFDPGASTKVARTRCALVANSRPAQWQNCETSSLAGLRPAFAVRRAVPLLSLVPPSSVEPLPGRVFAAGADSRRRRGQTSQRRRWTGRSCR